MEANDVWCWVHVAQFQISQMKDGQSWGKWSNRGSKTALVGLMMRRLFFFMSFFFIFKDHPYDNADF